MSSEALAIHDAGRATTHPQKKRGGSQSTTLRIATWNVREGIQSGSLATSSRVNNLPKVAKLINAYEIDVVALQEVDIDSAGESAVLEALSKSTNLKYQRMSPLSQSSFDKSGYSGVAVASRFPITDATSHDLPTPNLTTHTSGHSVSIYDKGIIVCYLTIAGKESCIISLHFYPFHRFDRSAADREFAKVWRHLAEYIDKHSQHPLIVAGDFNTAKRELILDLTANSLVRAIGDQPTHKGIATDDILFSSDFTLNDTPVVVENFSDHSLCIANFLV